MRRRSRVVWGIAMALSLLVLRSGTGRGQGSGEGRGDAALIVAGKVQDIFRSETTSKSELVQILVERSELGPRGIEPRRVWVPAPGDSVYVHGGRWRNVGPGGQGVELASRRLAPGVRVRVGLAARDSGGWEAVELEWLDQTEAPAASDSTVLGDAGRPASPPVSDAGLERLGVRAEALKSGGRLVLRVTEVLADRPAQRAGIEPGDVILGVDGQGMNSLEEFRRLIERAGATAKLAVLDHRSGQQAIVPVALAAANQAPPPQVPELPPAASPARSLGVRVAPARIGLKVALRVQSVAPGSPAQKAGIEDGDLIVEADGVATTDEGQLAAAVRKAGTVMKLKIRDHRSGREVPVEVALEPGGEAAEEPGAARPSPTARTDAAGLGIATEAAEVDLLPVVKIVSVTPGSPAARAGLEPGDLIVAVDEKVVFAPELLDQAIAKAGSTLTVTVLDPKTGKRTPVKIHR
jgi:serine protease Do